MDRINQLEASIDHAKARVEKAKAVLALFDNANFQEVVVKGYFEKEAIRMVACYGDGTGTPEMLADLQKDMHAVGAFRRYLSMIIQDGRQAESDVRQNQETLQEELAMRAEAQRMGQEMPSEIDPDYAGNLGA